MPLPYPVLLADIGGTMPASPSSSRPGLGRHRSGRCRRPASAPPLDALQAYLDEPRTPRPRSTCLAVARRVAGGVTRLTNAPWRFDLGGIGVALGLEAVRLVNDYAPLAAVLGILEEDDPADLVRIGAAVAGTGPRLVLGPGTGLGAAALIPAGDHLLIQNTEAGHVGFGPCERHDGLPWSELMPAGVGARPRPCCPVPAS